MGNYFGVPLLILAAVLQVTFVPQIRVLNGEPDLIFLLVLAYALRAPLEEGVTWAFVGGILADLLSAAPTGMTALGLVLLVFATDRLRRQVAGVGFLTIIAVTLVGTLLVKVVTFIVLLLIGYGLSPFEALISNVVPTMAYNLILIFPIYLFVRRFCPTPNPV